MSCHPRRGHACGGEQCGGRGRRCSSCLEGKEERWDCEKGRRARRANEVEENGRGGNSEGEEVIKLAASFKS